MNRFYLSLLFSCYINFAAGQLITVDSALVPVFGTVHTYSVKSAVPSNLIIMISGDGGWKYGVPEFAKEFAKMNSVVVGVDILKYYKHLRQQNTECYMVSSDFVELATEFEHKFNFPQYIPPILMGYSSGATLVYGILAQSRAGTFTGGISLGFCPDMELPKMLCQVNGLKSDELVREKSFILRPDENLGNQWIVLQGKQDKICDFQKVSDFVNGTGRAKIIALSSVGHGFSKWSDFMPEWKTAYGELIAKSNSYNPVHNNHPQASDFESVITLGKPGVNSNIIALFFSGDGGWYGFEQSIANRLAETGISTIGIDTKKFLWKRKDPDAASKEMTEILKYYADQWNRNRFVIIGYSQGAEIVPFIFNRFPEEIRNNTKSLVMLSPGVKTDFEIHVTGMLGIGNNQYPFDVISEILKIKNTREIFIFGANEKTSVPELLKNSEAEIVNIPGDHHFNRDYALIIRSMTEKQAF